MSIETWGEMPKSQESNEKPEEAIARLISEHEADPDAHLGANESLAAHRQNEVLDHLAGSVVADKLSFTEVVASTVFESLDNWDIVGSVVLQSFPGVYLTAQSGVSAYSAISRVLAYSLSSGTFDKDFILQFAFKVRVYGANNSWAFGFGQIFSDTQDGFGLRWDGTDVKAFVAVEAGTTYSAALTFANDANHVVRFHFIKADEKLHVYIDGVLVHTFDMADLGFGDDAVAYYEIGQSSTSYLYVNLYNIIAVISTT